MANKIRVSKTCAKGHIYFKRSDCPVCPVCEKEINSQDGFLSELSAPARRALKSNHIKCVEDLCHFSEKDLLTFHGLGKSSIPIIKRALEKVGLTLIKV